MKVKMKKMNKLKNMNTKKNEVDKNLESLINVDHEEEKRKVYLNETFFLKKQLLEMIQ